MSFEDDAVEVTRQNGVGVGPVAVRPMFFASAHRERRREVVDAAAAQRIEVPIHARLPLPSFEEAWQMQAARRVRGKIVIG